jgi:hypothetical protein
MGKVAMSRGQRILGLLAFAIGKPIAWIYRILFRGFDEGAAERRNARFAIEVQETFDRLLPDRPTSVRPPIHFAPAFDYSCAVAEYPDRRFSFARGRYEFTVALTMENRSVDVAVFSTSMPTSSGSNGGDGGAAEHSVRFLRRYWDRLPNASFNELQAMMEEFNGPRPDVQMP